MLKQIFTNQNKDKADSNTQDFTPEEKKQRFEWFLTNRRRTSRLALIQCLYNYELYKLTDTQVESLDFAKPTYRNVNFIFKSVLYIYRSYFFKGKYGTTKKTQKIEEGLVKKYLYNILEREVEIDEYIKKYIKKRWTVNRLDPIVRAILRAGTYELLYILKIKESVILSEYVNLTRSFFSGAEVGFVNAILDQISKEIRVPVKK